MLAIPSGMPHAPLEHLDLGENRLGDLPPLGLFPRLREVHVQQNGLRELPVAELLPLCQCQTLDVSMNDVSQLPPELVRDGKDRTHPLLHRLLTASRDEKVRAHCRRDRASRIMLMVPRPCCRRCKT